MIAEARRLLKTFSKFDQNYFAVKDPQGLLSLILQSPKNLINNHIEINIQWVECPASIRELRLEFNYECFLSHTHDI